MESLGKYKLTQYLASNCRSTEVCSVVAADKSEARGIAANLPIFIVCMEFCTLMCFVFLCQKSGSHLN